MPSETIRCSECGAPVRGVPSWLAGADVKFTCSSCPRRSGRVARFEPAGESRVALAGDADPDLDLAEIDDLDEDADADLEMSEELDDAKEDKDL